ncbi:hypothetical protein E4U39_003958 [Claviceps sp. Clav50 group G5]|nr:hypothetical protein E4U39_003958 [Claviceps sp. Clav50 group G5]
MFNQLHEAQRYREAVVIIRYYSQCLDRIPHTRGHVELTRGYWVSMAQVLLSVPQLPPLVKANVMTQLADKGDEVLNDVEIIRLEDEAVAIYNKEGHTVGATLIRCQRIIREGKRDPTLFTPAIFEEMNRHFATYEAFQAIHMSQVTVTNLVSHTHRGLRPNDNLHRFCITCISNRVTVISGNTFAGLDARKYEIGVRLERPDTSYSALILCTTLYANLEGTDNRLDQGMAAHMACKAHMQLRNWTLADEWAQKAAAMWADGFPTLRVGAIDSVIQAKIGRDIWDPDALEDILRYVEKETMVDERHNQLESVFPRMRAIEHMYNLLRGRVQARELPYVGTYGREVQAATRLRELREKIEVGVKTIEVRHAFLLRERAIKLAEAVDNPVLVEWESCMNSFNKAANLFQVHLVFSEAGKTRLRQSQALFKKFEIDYNIGLLLRCNDLVEMAVDFFARSECLQSLTEAQHWKSAFLQAAWGRGKLPGHAVLRALRDAEGAWARERSDMTKFMSLEAKSRPRSFTPFQDLQTIYLRAFEVCLEDKKPQELWNWVQREKARSLCDQLGAESPPCAEVRERSLSSVRRNGFEDSLDSCLKKLVLDAPPESLERQLRVTRDLLVAHNRASNSMAVLMGALVSRHCASKLATEMKQECPGRNTVFADWVEYYDAFWLVVLGGDYNHPSVTKCKISVKQVKSWKKKWLDAEPGEQSALQKGDRHAEDDDNFCLRALDALVAPLQRQSQPGDLLVLLPTGILHSIPLHALWLPSRMLILERNPIVYSDSLTTFRQCCTRAKRTAVAVCRLPKCDRDREWVFAGVYERKRGRTFYADEQTETYSFISRTAEGINSSWATGTRVRKTWVRNALERSSLFLFLGTFDVEDTYIEEQGLELGRGMLKMGDVLNMTLQAPHVGLVELDSAEQGKSRKKASNVPPPGIMMTRAFLWGGAGSVVASIWPTSPRVGRQFVSEMYGDMVEERRRCCRETAVVDLAEKMRRAVLALRSRVETRQPYHWAGFALHGCWAMYTV